VTPICYNHAFSGLAPCFSRTLHPNTGLHVEDQDPTGQTLPKGGAVDYDCHVTVKVDTRVGLVAHVPTTSNLLCPRPEGEQAAGSRVRDSFLDISRCPMFGKGKGHHHPPEPELSTRLIQIDAVTRDGRALEKARDGLFIGRISPIRRPSQCHDFQNRV